MYIKLNEYFIQKNFSKVCYWGSLTLKEGRKMRENENIYQMQSIQMLEKKQRNQTIAFGMVLLVLTTILIILGITILQNIEKAKEAKLYEQELLIEAEKQKKIQIEKEKEEERKKQEKLPIVTEKGLENFNSIWRSDTRRVFLTFDDGPSPVTPSILQTLKERNVKASFFMLGTNVKNYPELTKQVYEEGHYIANHGYSHRYEIIYASPEMVLQEYNETNQEIQKAIGESEYNSHLFRFPGGFVGGKYESIKKQAKELLNQNNILNIDWNCLSGDAETTTPTPQYLMKRIQETSSGKNSVIVLMHDAQAKQATANTLPQIIDYFVEQGYEFKTFYDIFEK